jgi:hypothetical protein
MPTLYISFTDFIYVRLTAVIWINNGLVNVNNLPKASADYLTQVYESIEIKKPIIIDCKNVSNIIDHSWDLLFKSIAKNKRNVFFINSTGIEQKIALSHNEFCKTGKYQIIDHFVSITFSDTFEVTEVVLKSISQKLQENCESYILSTFCKHEKGEYRLLSSTPFYANGEYTASKLLTSRDTFVWLSISFADFLQSEIERHQIGKEKGYPLKLLSVTLRSAPFASALSLLLNYSLQTIEFLGPQRNYLGSKSQNYSDKYEYLYIGDFSFAGTEIRITQMYAYMNGCKLKHAFVLGSLFLKDRFSDFVLHSLTDLNKNKNADYKLF